MGAEKLEINNKKFPDRVKCAAIHMSNLSYSKGTFTGGGLGISSGGLGLAGFGGVTSGSNISALAKMFEPIVLQSPEHDISNTIFLVGGGTLLISSCIYIWGLETFGEPGAQLLIILVGIVIGMVAGRFEYKNAINHADVLVEFTRRKDLAENNYNQIYYSPKEHMIFIDEDHALPATRENFIKIVLG